MNPALRAFLNGLDRFAIQWMRHLPPRLAHGGAGFFAHTVFPLRYPLAGRRAAAALAQLAPERPQPEAMREVWESYGRAMMEMGCFIRFLDEGRVELTGQELLAPRPLVICGVHLGSWEVLIQAVARLCPGMIMPYQPPHTDYRHRFIVAERERGGARLLPAERASAQVMMSHLREAKGPLLIFTDEVRDGRVSAPSLGRGPRASGHIDYAVRLARASAATMVLAWCERLEPRADGPRFRVAFEALEPVPRDGAREADIAAGIAALDARMETLIRPRLTQWYMLTEWENLP